MIVRAGEVCTVWRACSGWHPRLFVLPIPWIVAWLCRWAIPSRRSRLLEQHVEPAGIRGVPVSLSTRSRNASKARVFLAFGVFERDAVAKEAGTVRDRTSGSGRSVQRGRECDAANRWVDRAERWRAASDSRWSSVARRINAKPACRKSAAWRANSRLRRWYPSVVWLTIIAFLLASTFSDSSS